MCYNLCSLARSYNCINAWFYENKLIITYNSALRQCTTASLSSTVRSLTYSNGEIWIWFLYSLGYFDIHANQYDPITFFMVLFLVS